MDTGSEQIGTGRELPLEELWRDGVRVDAQRGRWLREEIVRGLLRGGVAAVVVAEVGRALEWLEGAAVFEVWERELRGRVASPEGFRLEEFEGGRCYLASEWRGNAGVIVVFECHH